MDGTCPGTYIVSYPILMITLNCSESFEQIRAVMEGRTYTKYLQNWNVAVMKDLQAYKHSRLVLQFSNQEVCEALKQTKSYKPKTKGIIMSAIIVFSNVAISLLYVCCNNLLSCRWDLSVLI